MKLSQLKKIDLHKVWRQEAWGCTQWLTKKEDFSSLGRFSLQDRTTEQPAEKWEAPPNHIQEKREIQ